VKTSKRKALAAVALSAVCLLTLSASQVFAANTHEYLGSFAAPLSSRSASIAVDNSGNVYVFVQNALYKLSSTGEPVNFSATGTNVIENKQFTGEAIAVDNSTDPADPARGDIYVLESQVYELPSGGIWSRTVVAIYSPSGERIGELNENVRTEAPGAPWPDRESEQRLAVDRHGNLYVTLYSEWVNEFSPTTNPVMGSDYVGSLWGMLGVMGIALDGKGDVFVSQQGQGRIDRYEALQFNDFGGAALGSTVYGQLGLAASDQSRDRVYIAHAASLLAFDSSGEIVERFEPDPSVLTGWGPTAVNEANGDIYVYGGGRVTVFGPSVVVPDATTEAADVTTTTVTLRGTVNPEGLEAGCYFEYGTTNAYGSTVPCSSAPGSGASPVAVHAEISGLSPSSLYHFRLVATNSNGKSNGEDRTFALPFPPAIEGESVTGIGLSTAAVEASISPAGYETTFRVEYGTDTSYGTSVPVPDAYIGPSFAPVHVKQLLTELQPGITYHYRVVATNANGTVEGPDRTFTTFAMPVVNSTDTCPNAAYRTGLSAGLPDCRTYEMVTPVEKSGTDVWATGIDPFVASASGEHIEFPTRTGFGDTKGSGGLGYSQFVSSRTPSGWVTKGITPSPALNTPLELGLPMTFVIDFSEEFERSVVSGYDLPGIEDAAPDSLNLYLEDPVSGELLEAITNVSNEGENLKLAAFSRTSTLGGSSSDMNVVTFATKLNLVPQAKGSEPKVYALENGVITLVGILPNGKVPTGGSYLARESVTGEAFDRAAISYKDTVSRDGSRIFFRSPVTGEESQLYLRRNGSETVLVSQSEGSEAVTPRNVMFQAATPDGSKVVFSTTSRLLDSDPGGNGVGLYLYTDSPNPETESNLTFIARFGGGPSEAIVKSISEDGKRIYFTNGEALLLWDDGVMHQAAPETGASGVSFNSSAYSNGKEMLVSRDGRRLAFLNYYKPTRDNVVRELPFEHGFKNAELYVYDEASEKLTCVSCPHNGATATLGVEVASNAITEAVPFTALSSQPRFFTQDGRYAFFSTRESLLPQDTNGVADAYEYDVQTGKLSLLSTGYGEVGTWFVEASQDGRDVFLATRQQLSAWDPDKLVDLYDARAGGGLPGPPEAPAPCSGDACQGTPLAPPTFGTASEFNGLGNPAPVALAKTKAAPLRRVQLLKRGLTQCRKLKSKRRRRRCEVAVRRRYHTSGSVAKRASRGQRQGGR
jgi:hypothetical protein